MCEKYSSFSLIQELCNHDLYLRILSLSPFILTTPTNTIPINQRLIVAIFLLVVLQTAPKSAEIIVALPLQYTVYYKCRAFKNVSSKVQPLSSY